MEMPSRFEEVTVLLIYPRMSISLADGVKVVELLHVLLCISWWWIVHSVVVLLLSLYPFTVLGVRLGVNI